MRVEIELDSANRTIPIHYNHALQGSIYSMLSEDLRTFLHNKGFKFGKRSFKLFTFSRIISSKIRRRKFELEFLDYAKLYISSPIHEFIKDLANSLLKLGRIRIYSTDLSVRRIKIIDGFEISDEGIFRTLSPVTIYSTFITFDGKKYTHYYDIKDPKASELLMKNLLKKSFLLGLKPEEEKFSIKPINYRKVIVLFKNTPITAYEGIFEIKGDPVLLKVMYETGLGNKNSAGFGMLEVVDRA